MLRKSLLDGGIYKVVNSLCGSMYAAFCGLVQGGVKCHGRILGGGVWLPADAFITFKIPVYGLLESGANICNRLAVESDDVPYPEDTANKAFVLGAELYNGFEAFVFNCFVGNHGVSPKDSRYSRIRRTWYGFTSFCGWGECRYNIRSPFTKDTRELDPCIKSQPQPFSNDMHSCHVRLVGVGVLKIAARVRFCLLFITLNNITLLPGVKKGAV